MMKKVALLLILFAMIFGGRSMSQGWNYVNNTGTSFILYGMSFPPGQSTIGYACGMQYTYNADGVIVKTIDGGNNWTQIWPTSGSVDGLQGIWFVNDTVGFACGWNNYFIKTTDGGSTWTPITVGSNVWYYVDVEFWDENNGVAAAYMNNPGDQAVFITNDGGNTWVTATSGVGTNEIMGLSYADQNTIFAVGTGANVLKSTDGGHNWSTVATLSALLFGVDFANPSFGVVGGEEEMFATNDGGTTWTTYTTGYENFYGTKAFADGTAYVGGTDENIYITTDYGNTWSMDNNGSGSAHLYRIRFTDNMTAFACGSQGTILIQEPLFNADFVADVTDICEGDAVNFTDQSTGTIVSWEWSFEGGSPATSSIQNPSVNYNTAGSYDVQLVISDGSTTDTLLRENYIIVDAIPAQASKPTGPNTVCEGGSYDYSTSSVTYADSYDWELDPPAAGTLTGDGTMVTFAAANGYLGNYSIKVRAENNCGSGNWSDTILCTVYHQPEQFNLTGGGPYCEGSQGIEIVLQGSETGVDYELFLDDISTNIILPGTGSALSFGYQTEVGFYTATGYTDHCSEVMLGENYIFVQPLPGQAGTPGGPETVCAGDTALYTTAGATNGDSYTWSLIPEEAGVLMPNGTEVEIAWDAQFTGEAYLSVTSSNDCGDGATSDELLINVEAAPQPVVSGEPLVCENTAEDYMTAMVTGNTYTWEVTGGTIINGAGTNIVTVQWGSPGSGSLIVTEDNGTCSATSEVFMVTIDECPGIFEPTEGILKVYPNPANSNLTVSLPSDLMRGNYTIKIMDGLGSNVIEVEIDEGQDSITIATSSLYTGVYYVQLTDNEKLILSAKFMVAR